MIRARLFIILSAILLTLAANIESILPVQNPFLFATESRQVVLDKVSSPDFGKMKVRHGLTQKRFDIGLFGNSRSLDIGAEHLNLGSCSYFNFSLSGESIRANVALLEQLAANKKAPRVALISVDNFELQFYSNPFFLTLTERWRQGMQDIWFGLTQTRVSGTDVLNMIWRHAYTEWLLFKLNFDITQQWPKIFRIVNADAATFTSTQELGKGYRPDGSRTQILLEPDVNTRHKLTSGPRQVLSGYLRYDLMRLKLLSKSGMMIIVYESPLDNPNTKKFIERPSPQALYSRKEFFRICSEFGLSCHSALGKLPSHNTPWRDSNHAPAGVLGSYLQTLLGNNVRTCGRDF
jgi:hypothetical protein